MKLSERLRRLEALRRMEQPGYVILVGDECDAPDALPLGCKVIDLDDDAPATGYRHISPDDRPD